MGIQISSKRHEVVSRLGKPIKSEKGIDSVMGMGEWEVMYFHGLILEVIKPKPAPGSKGIEEPYVSRILISGQAWRTKSGLRIGDSREQVINTFGPPASEDAKDGVITLHYDIPGFDGFFWVSLKSNKVVELGVSEDWT